MAEMIFIDTLRREGLAHRVQVSSAGTGPWHVGDPADPRAAESLRRAGYDCTHTAAQLGAQHLSADLLVVLLRSFDRAAGRDLDVPDPYFGGDPGFDDVLRMVRAAMPGLMAWVRERL
jgi:protein-tyrosine phosphatase